MILEIARMLLLVIGIALMMGGWFPEPWGGGVFIPSYFWSGWVIITIALFLFHWIAMLGWLGLWAWLFIASRSRQDEAGKEPRGVGSPRRGGGDEMGADVADQTMPGDDVLYLHTNRRPNACPHIYGLIERRLRR